MRAPARSGALAGLRVLELSGIGPGPFAAMLLGDMGADVVRVDRPEVLRGPAVQPTDLLRRSRRSVALDLKSEHDLGILLRLVDRADVLIEGYRPGVAERLGFGPKVCLDRNPGLVYGRMTGWGQGGPLAQTAGHDITYLAVSGALHVVGRAGEPPAIPVNLLGDFGGGSAYLVMGILAALHERHTSGLGQVVDAAIVDGAASLTTFLHGLVHSGEWQDERGVNLLDSGRPWYDVYRCSDDRHVAVGALEPKFFAELMHGLGLDPDSWDRDDESSWPALRAELAGRFASRTRDEWSEHFAGTDACVAPVLGLAEAAISAHARARQAFVTVDEVAQPAPAPRLSRTPSRGLTPPAGHGEHAAEVLGEWGVAGIDGGRAGAPTSSG
ncbi:CaiB/BaiF CoA-transferase family protein [Pseudonocardia xishanensis]|uniref:CaiB/BaiF CoA-transferase family protein n=1 Tax=Pseudonocardia xishanensis TaxID=630995 RepID=A0ABP8S0H1_9PSEU